MSDLQCERLCIDFCNKYEEANAEIRRQHAEIERLTNELIYMSFISKDQQAEIERLKNEVCYLENDYNAVFYHYKKLYQKYSSQQAEIERLKSALTRLSSMEAFVTARAVITGGDDELLSRINYAQKALNHG